jgi:Zn-dependent protease
MSKAGLREIVHLVASLIVLTIAFTYPNLSPELLLVSAFGVGIGFIFHELAHKFTAQKYGFVADFEASPVGLLLALGMSVITNGSLVFAAPGAVMIRGKRVYAPENMYRETPENAREMAYISVSGAVVNLVIAITFYAGSFFVEHQSLIHTILVRGAFINVFLAGFNMIPFGPLDGAKVWNYDRILWALVGIPSIILFFIL